MIFLGKFHQIVFTFTQLGRLFIVGLFVGVVLLEEVSIKPLLSVSLRCLEGSCRGCHMTKRNVYFWHDFT